MKKTKFKILILSMCQASPNDDPEEDDRKPAAKTIKKEPEDEAQSVAQDDQKVETTFKPGKTRRTIKLYSGSIYLLVRMVKNTMT